MGQIYISSLAFKGISINEIDRIAQQHGFSIEFTSNIPFYDGLMDDFVMVKATKTVHNYFPTPKHPFVLNLASADDSIRSRSLAHCIEGMKLCKDAGAPFFAAHAGFCVDPRPEDLGKSFSLDQEFDREKHVKLFLRSLKSLLETAEQLRIPFLFENNVLIESNLTDEKVNPLLCCDAQEIRFFLDEIGSNYLGFLLDTAHLKVSATTLGHNLEEEAKSLNEYVTAIHHSDNNGYIDNNKPMNSDYWFLKHLGEHGKKVHVVEVNDLTIEEIKQQIALLETSWR